MNIKPNFVTARDGTRLHIQDWGEGRPLVFLSAWAFASEVWGSYLAYYQAQGFRCIALDRRGHGRSDVPTSGYDAVTLASDVAAVLEELDLENVTIVAHSMASVEAVQLSTQEAFRRVVKLVLLAPTTPYLTQTEDNPEGIPPEMIEAQYSEIATNYAKWLHENEPPFFVEETDPVTRAWILNMMLTVPLPAGLACRRTIAGADLREALKKLRVPTLVIHGDKDASAPHEITGMRTAALIPNSKLIMVEGAPHGLIFTHRDRLLAEMTPFIED